MHDCLFCFKNGKKGSDIHLYRSWIQGTRPYEFYYEINGGRTTKEKYLGYYNKYFDRTNVNGQYVYKGTKLYPFVENTSANRVKKLK